jgi:hypothetical protein
MDPDPRIFWLTDPAPDPALLSVTFKTQTKNNFFSLLCLVLFEGTFTSFFKTESQKVSQNSRNQGFSSFLLVDGRGRIRIQEAQKHINMWNVKISISMRIYKTAPIKHKILNTIPDGQKCRYTSDYHQCWDPDVCGPPGSGSIRQRYGSGSGYFPFLIKVLSGLK